MALSAAQIEASAGFQDITVDIKSLGDFADLLRKELETNLEPAWQKLGGDALLGDRPQFGKSAELDLGNASVEYSEYLRESRLLLRNLITGTKLIADAADRIAAQYRGADQFASIQAEQVHQYLPAIVAPASSTDDF